MVNITSIDKTPNEVTEDLLHTRTFEKDLSKNYIGGCLVRGLVKFDKVELVGSSTLRDSDTRVRNLTSIDPLRNIY